MRATAARVLSRSRRHASTLPAAVHIPTWVRENQASFAPPVMNKLLHREQLSVMFVGGPNQREDFHLEEGSEFFYQLKGDMALPTIQAGELEVVHIREGDVFLLPSRIPHSPQRPNPGSLGLVIERQRYEHEPPDGLRWYTDFTKCDQVLWERYFHCYDLGRDLVPVVTAYNESEEKRTRVPTAESVVCNPPLQQDTTTRVPPPFRLSEWLEANAAALDSGSVLNLFEGHPDGEFSVRVAGGRSEQIVTEPWPHETWLYQLSGSARVEMSAEDGGSGSSGSSGGSSSGGGSVTMLEEGACLVVPAGARFRVERPEESRGLVVTNDPLGNKGRG